MMGRKKHWQHSAVCCFCPEQNAVRRNASAIACYWRLLHFHTRIGTPHHSIE